MRGNQYGKLFSVTSFGESHGEALGAIVDGVPAGLDFSLEDLASDLKKRAPGQSKGTTNRREPDIPEVLSGIFNGKTLGTPICVVVRNTNQKSSDYDKLKNEYRPGHADQTTVAKYGIRDHRGGGRSSGRETLSRVIAGHFASLIIPEISFSAQIIQMGKLTGDKLQNANEVEDYLESLKRNGDSVGGEISLTISDCPAGLGEPVFDKLKADLAKAMLSIGGCVSFAYGIGSDFLIKSGIEISTDRNNFGGIEGGISNGAPIVVTLGFKPVSTVGEKAKEGRHDPCILPRVIPVVIAMAQITIADHFLRQNAYQLGSR